MTRMTLVNPYRKPVTFPQYHFLLVKTGGIWCLDCGTWDFQSIKQSESALCKVFDKWNVKLCSSPSDDERVITKIISAYNHNKR